MRAANFHLLLQTDKLSKITTSFVKHSAQLVRGTWLFIVIPIKTVKVIVEQMSQVSGCLQLKDQALMRVILLLMEVRAASDPKNLKSTKYL
jgi:hypothetical protein